MDESMDTVRSPEVEYIDGHESTAVDSNEKKDKKRPSTDFMAKVHKDINPSMRAILIDWLVEVLQMESVVLNYLKFEMTAPTAKCILRRFVRAAQGLNEVVTCNVYGRASLNRERLCFVVININIAVE
uniref:Cyclin A n=1 Tax=Solanum tuberosum TaxID=4113 RepID=M1AVE9_SOLTU